MADQGQTWKAMSKLLKKLEGWRDDVGACSISQRWWWCKIAAVIVILITSLSECRLVYRNMVLTQYTQLSKSVVRGSLYQHQKLYLLKRMITHFHTSRSTMYQFIHILIFFHVLMKICEEPSLNVLFLFI